MSFLFKNGKLLEKYESIWDKFSKIMKKVFLKDPAYEKNLKDEIL